jgi:glycosyltransferase involved in cell wall biosynthesis
MNKTPHIKKISILSPCYNEEDNVRACYESVRTLFDIELPNYQREHIFVDNCSTDSTVTILRQIAGSDPMIKIIVNARNFGLFRSTFNGLQYATGDSLLVMLPVDMQDPPDMLPEFVRLWESGYDVVAGIRANRQEGILMRFSRRVFYKIVNRLAGFEIPENVGEFQLIDRKVLNQVLKFNDHYPYIRGIIAACGFKRILVPYIWKARKRGFSKIRMWELIDQALNGILSFSNVPMRLCTLTGFGFAILCLFYAMLSLFLYFLIPSAAPRGNISLVVGVFFLFSLQLVFIGLLGEYVMAIHAQVRRGPLVVERERINVD